MSNLNIAFNLVLFMHLYLQLFLKDKRKEKEIKISQILTLQSQPVKVNTEFLFSGIK